MFTHLHNHTDYSILDGAASIDKLIARAVELGQSSLAVTEHGNMFSAYKFAKTCQDAGIKPILGCEYYMAADTIERRDKTLDRKSTHLVLLAKNNVGYHNLIQLTTIANTVGFYYKPRIDMKTLSQHSEGLICLSACIGGHLPQTILNYGMDAAEILVNQYLDMFGNDFYIELQDHGIEDEQRVLPDLLSLAETYDIPLVATNDIHYVREEDWETHDLLWTIQLNQKMDNPERKLFPGDHAYYLKDEEEMRVLGFPEEAYANTNRIAAICDVHLDEFATAGLPSPYPEGYACDRILVDSANTGLEAKVGCPLPPEYQERLHYELGVIQERGFSKYMLIVRQITEYCRSNNIHIGPRGSAAGSLVSYALAITDVDPIVHDLTFERFLNPERVEMPDIDLDIEDTRREDLIAETKRVYGNDNVAQIATFGVFKAKSAIRDVARVYGMSSVGESVAKTIPDFPTGLTIAELQETSTDFATVCINPAAKFIVNKAKLVEGLHKTCGVHPAGVVISAKPLIDFVPLMHDKNGKTVVQVDMETAAILGLLKMDFLGLSNLTILSQTLDLLNCRGVRLKLEDIPMDDQETYASLSRGLTGGVFQLESYGMTKYIRKLKPTSLADLAAMIALYRPGPIQHIQEFIERKHGWKRVEYPHNDLRAILDETFGVIVYQDQVLQIAHTFAGYSLGHADLFRKAMGKKKPEIMAEQLEDFINGAKAKGYTEEIARKIFNLIEPFAGYAFNKAHATCYAILSYRTAYLRTHHPLEYYTCLFEANRDSDDRSSLQRYIEEASIVGIQVGCPDIFTSGARFSIDKGVIRYGLNCIKGLGETTVEKIIRARECADSRFVSLDVSTTKILDIYISTGINVRQLAALIYAGAMDKLGTRGKMIAQIPLLAAAKKALSTGKKVEETQTALQDVEPINDNWDEKQREVLGTTITNATVNTRLFIDTPHMNADLLTTLRQYPGTTPVMYLSQGRLTYTDVYVKADGVLLRRLDSLGCEYGLYE